MIIVSAIQPGERAITVDCGHMVRTWIECADGRRVCVQCWKQCRNEVSHETH